MFSTLILISQGINIRAVVPISVPFDKNYLQKGTLIQIFRNYYFYIKLTDQHN